MTGAYAPFIIIGGVTEGNTLSEAIQMAEDALGIYMYSLKEDKEQAPEPSNPTDVETERQDFVKLIELDADSLRPANKKYRNYPV